MASSEPFHMKGMLKIHVLEIVNGILRTFSYEGDAENTCANHSPTMILTKKN
jgi:hypothetical protein